MAENGKQIAANLGASVVGQIPEAGGGAFGAAKLANDVACLWYRDVDSSRPAEATMPTSESLIQKTPGVIGGDACIRRTRIAVWMLVEAKKLGRTDTDLLADFPALTQDDLNAAWVYSAANPEEIEMAIRENNEAE